MRAVLVRLSAVGDIVHTWPLAASLRTARPDLHLTWVVEEPLRPLVEGHPAVDQVVTTATRRWRRRPLSSPTRQEVRALRARFSDLAPHVTLDPQGVLKSAFVTRWTGAEHRVGLARPWRREWIAGFAYTSLLPGSDDPHVIATNVEMVRAVGGVPPARPPAPDGRWLLHRGETPPAFTEIGSTYAVLLPATAHRRKEVPVPILAGLGRRMAAAGLDVVAAWGPGERSLAEAVREAAEGRVRVAPPTGLLELARLLAGATVVVGGDTGPTHIAASLGVPTLAIFTATDWRRNAPLGARVDVLATAGVGEDPLRSGARAKRRQPPTVDELTTAVGRLIDTRVP